MIRCWYTAWMRYDWSNGDTERVMEAAMLNSVHRTPV